MENQHRKIKGYRELSQEEIDLMNEIKAKGAELGDLVAKIEQHLVDQRKAQMDDRLTSGGSNESYREEQRLNAAQPQRWAAIAKTDFQTGLMALTRAVAQPETF